MHLEDTIYLAGHTGLVGSSIAKLLQAQGYSNILTRTRTELNLLDQPAVDAFFEQNRPKYVIDAAARVGGIRANMTYKADFLYENLQIQNNLIWAAHRVDVAKFLFLGSSCIYPRSCPQPMREEYFMEGKVEPTNEGYAIAKIAGMKLCETIYEQFGQMFISCMPTNVYGPGDHFDPESSHVIPGMIHRMYQAKLKQEPEFTIWGTGETRREFLYVDDLADACVWLMQHYSDKAFLNVGTGQDVSINELAVMLKEIIWYEGTFVHDTGKPDGFPRKLLDVSRINTAGWQSQTNLKTWLIRTYEYYKNTVLAG